MPGAGRQDANKHQESAWRAGAEEGGGIHVIVAQARHRPTTSFEFQWRGRGGNRTEYTLTCGGGRHKAGKHVAARAERRAGKDGTRPRTSQRRKGTEGERKRMAKWRHSRHYTWERRVGKVGEHGYNMHDHRDQPGCNNAGAMTQELQQSAQGVSQGKSGESIQGPLEAPNRCETGVLWSWGYTSTNEARGKRDETDGLIIKNVVPKGQGPRGIQAAFIAIFEPRGPTRAMVDGTPMGAILADSGAPIRSDDG
ncbi:hypothetical protein DFH07DRAFT_769503 [Mycena maculata]|uniref:Uncharacterized protein n=1 Tax=Mycena maculata TaxID=230809 RepID=A0AAD7NN02_9AGAR|nr:hypothetical protein DFH07DRAFT_769503 [Mycena maculata]